MRLDVPSRQPEASAAVDAPPDAENRSLSQLDVLIAGDDFVTQRHE